VRLPLPVKGELLPDTAEVIRVIRKDNRFIPDDALLPISEAFVPTSEDKRIAAEHGEPVRVSVWDSRWTTVEQAKSFRKTEDLVWVFGASVNDLHAVGCKFSNPRLRVVADPLDPEDGAGALGHCGIEGLDREKGSDRLRHKELLDEIAIKFSKSYQDGPLESRPSSPSSESSPEVASQNKPSGPL